MQEDIKSKKKLLLATIENIDQEGRGVTHIDGKAIFVEGALQGELVECEHLLVFEELLDEQGVEHHRKVEIAILFSDRCTRVLQKDDVGGFWIVSSEVLGTSTTPPPL